MNTSERPQYNVNRVKCTNVEHDKTDTSEAITIHKNMKGCVNRKVKK